MTTREDLLQAGREWLQAATGTALTDSQVIVAQDAGPRPTADYVTVQVLTEGVPRGGLEHLDDVSGGLPRRKTRSHERATVSFQAYGPDAVEWLTKALRGRATTAAVAPLRTAGVTLRPLGGVINLTALRDTRWEARASLDVELNYSVDTTPVAGIAVLTAEVTATTTPLPSLAVSFTAP